MAKANDCRFCKMHNKGLEGKENFPIWENDKYFSLASIGAFVPGWILIIPKEHMCSMKDVYADKEFINFADEALFALRSKYSASIIAFEHGSNKYDSKTSCGTNHAHLHLIPYPKSLFEDMLKSGMSWESCRPDQISSFVGNKEYLFYSEIAEGSSWTNPEGFIHLLNEQNSQYFRKLMAKQLNYEDEYDYKKHPRIEMAIETNSILSNAIAC